MSTRQAWGAESPYYHWWITAVLMLGFTTAGLSVTVVNLAFPKMMTSLRADLDVIQWVQTGYMIMQGDDAQCWMARGTLGEPQAVLTLSGAL